MLTESTELTLAHVGLGHLDEFAAMVLLGDAHCHGITAGTGGHIGNITDTRGVLLYPGYYYTKFVVPPNRRLERHRVWDRVSVAVDVRSFGGMLLESEYVIGKMGEFSEDPRTWRESGLPWMHAGNTFTIDGLEGEPQAAVPKEGTVATLPKLTSAPRPLQRFREIRALARFDPECEAPLQSSKALEYSLICGRDFPAGHGIMFATFVRIFDVIERLFLTRHTWPRLPTDLMNCATLLERETCYWSNVRSEQTLLADVRCRLDKCPVDYHGKTEDISSGGILTTYMELYLERDSSLLASTKSRKLFAIPRQRQSVLRDAERIIASHSNHASGGMKR